MTMQHKTRRRVGVALAAIGLISLGAGFGAAVAAALIQQDIDTTARLAAKSSLERNRTQSDG
ncbi:MAG: hypothetical protein P4L86_25355 [Mycobacterium sp.]|nr:hypothetical protein [Mycobacterium sp.]